MIKNKKEKKFEFNNFKQQLCAIFTYVCRYSQKQKKKKKIQLN